MALSAGEVDTARDHVRHHRNGRLVTLSVLTAIGVTGHFISYTFIVVIIREVVGVRGPHLAWLLAAFGIAGLISMARDGAATGSAAAGVGGRVPCGAGDRLRSAVGTGVP